MKRNSAFTKGLTAGTVILGVLFSSLYCSRAGAQETTVIIDTSKSIKTEPILARQQLPLKSKQCNSALFQYSSNTNIVFEHPAVAELRDGDALVSASRSTSVKTPHSLLHFSPGTLALVSVKDDVTQVRNLWERKKNGLSQTVSGKSYYISAGYETLASKDLRSIYLFASKDTIGRRLAHYTELADGSIIHFAELPLTSIAQNSNLLAQLMSSTNPLDKSVQARLKSLAMTKVVAQSDASISH